MQINKNRTPPVSRAQRTLIEPGPRPLEPQLPFPVGGPKGGLPFKAVYIGHSPAQRPAMTARCPQNQDGVPGTPAPVGTPSSFLCSEPPRRSSSPLIALLPSLPLRGNAFA